MMRETKTEKIIMVKPYGKYLGYSNMNFLIRDKQKNTVKKIPFYSIGEIVLSCGNTVSVGALSSMMFWGIDCLILNSSGRPVGTIKALNDDSHVKTRLAQMKAYSNRKGVEIAKQLILTKIEAQTQMLKKYKLILFNSLEIPTREQIKLLYAENIDKIRNRLHGIEGKYSEHYFSQIFTLIPKKIRPEKREGYRAYDGGNNLWNIAYEFLKWKIFRALIKAKLDPFLGYLHKIQENRPSLVCDLEEIYRGLVDNFLIQYSQKLTKKDFEKKYERGYYNKKIPRIYLNHSETNNLIRHLDKYFETKIEIPRIKRGKNQKIETLIVEECSLLAQFIRGKKLSWIPRIIIP